MKLTNSAKNLFKKSEKEPIRLVDYKKNGTLAQ